MLGILLSMFWLSPSLRNLRLNALARAYLSPAQAAALVAEGKISEEDAERLTGTPSSDGSDPAVPSNARGEG